MPKHLLITEPTLDNLTEFLAQHRALFGDLRMEGDGDGGDGGDGDGSGDGDGGDGGGDGDGDGADDNKPPAEPPALIEERNARKAAETILYDLLGGKKSKAEIRKALKTGGNALEALKPQKPAPKKDDADDKPDADQIRRDAEAAANERANVRIVSAEVRAIAAELFADPADAPLYLDLTDYDVDDDGNVDAKKIRADLKAVLERKKHLAKKGAQPKPDKSQGPKTDPAGEAGTGRRRLAGAYASSSSGK